MTARRTSDTTLATATKVHFPMGAIFNWYHDQFTNNSRIINNMLIIVQRRRRKKVMSRNTVLIFKGNSRHLYAHP